MSTKKSRDIIREKFDRAAQLAAQAVIIAEGGRMPKTEKQLGALLYKTLIVFMSSAVTFKAVTLNKNPNEGWPQ
jgi:cyanophycinase-like exopeptidase